MHRLIPSPLIPSPKVSPSRRSPALPAIAIALILLAAWTPAASSQTLPPLPVPPAAQSTPADDDPVADEPQADQSALDDSMFADRVAARAFGPPPDAKRISKSSNLWVDVAGKRVIIDGYVALTTGQLEMFACPTGSKEHESVFGLLAQSREVHAALLAIGAQPGTTVRYEPSFLPPTGQAIRIWVCYRDPEGKFVAVDGRQLIRSSRTKQPLSEDWVFAGSSFWKDPEDDREYYQADGGDMICVSNFTTAMLDVPFASSAENSGLLFEPMTEKLPRRATPVRVVLMPLPIPSDRVQPPPKIDPDSPPQESILPAPAAKTPPSTPDQPADDQPADDRAGDDQPADDRAGDDRPAGETDR